MSQDESGKPRSHTLECPSTVESLAVIDLAELDPPTNRISDSGTEGCFNDLHNGHPVTLYLLFTLSSAVSPLLDSFQSQ